MPGIPFCKFHGFGNDYIVIMRSDLTSDVRLDDLARSICERHTGAGSDGIAVLESSTTETSDYNCEIINPDGSTAGLSGNGTRCAVAYLYFKQLWNEPNLRLQTRSGVKNFTLIERLSPGHYWFEAEIGRPKFESAEVPFRSIKNLTSVIDQPVSVDGRQVRISGVNVGNPVACIFVEDFDREWRGLGKILEVHEAFPARANIVFVKKLDAENIEIRIWERGAGETSASGTCASGAAVLSALTGRTSRNVSVHSPGGTTQVVWRDDDEILITGRADLVYCGDWPA